MSVYTCFLYYALFINMDLGKFLLFLLLAFGACQYDEQLAHRLCKLLVSTYCRPQHVKQWTCKPCRDSPIQLTNVIPFYNSTGHVLGLTGISSNPRSIIVAFRGTIPWIIQNDIQDNDNVKVDFLPCNGKCKAQRGFYHAYLDIAGQVYRGVRDYMTRFQINDVIVTGHSMGGPLATHSAIDLVFHGIPVKYLYTFGSYRIGDIDLSRWFEGFMKNTQVYRVTHARDPVVHLPSQKIGFNHVVHQIFYPGSVKQGYKKCNDTNSIEDPTCADQHKLNPMVSDHVNYYGIDFLGIILECL